MNKETNRFSPEVEKKLATYVYRLIDPRNGEAFYVGKGKGNRVFAHVRAENSLDGDEIDNKLKRVREIRNSGFEVAHVIHRHGMDEKTAFEVEAALIDAYPGLTNFIGGSRGAEFGVMHADEIIRRYSAEPAIFVHKAILISVNRTAFDHSLYDATRFAWKIDPHRARKGEVVLATQQGLIIGAFRPSHWLPATPENFPGLGPPGGAPGRIGFVGEDAPEDMKRLYVGKGVPEEYRKHGAANPVKYTWK